LPANEEVPEVEIGDRVRLISALGDVPAGSEGVVFGFYRHPDRPALAVRFAGGSQSVPAELIEVVEHAGNGRHRRAG
jgi:hypothetical protein